MTATANPQTFTPFSTSIPAGPRSKAFDDEQDSKGRQITGVHSINVWVDKVVTGLQVTYTLASGKTYRAPVRGSGKGKKTRIRLEADEELIQLAGRGNTGSITSLSLLSTKSDGTVRLHGPFGDGELAIKKGGKNVAYRNYELLVGGSDDKGFSWYGGKIMAFTGEVRSGRPVGLGVKTAPIVEVAEGMSSTSVLTEEYRERVSGSRGQKKLESYPSYRSTVTLPSGTGKVTLWAEEQLKVTINGKAKTLDPQKPTEVTPNSVGKITVNVDATDISVPAIKIRTDQHTDPWQWYSLHPDVAVHEKIAAWDQDTLYQNRSKLGISNKYDKKDCAAVQSAVVNVSKLGLPGEGQAAHERKIDANNMDDANWMLDLEGDQLKYSKVSKSDASKAKGEASKITTTSAASGVKKLKKKARKGVKKAKGGVKKVVVETSKTKPVKSATKTVKKAGGGKVVKSAETLGKNVAKTSTKVAKDVAKGDIEGAAKHLGQGGLQLGKDVAKLGKHTVVTVINVAGEAVEYVLDRTVALGKLMWNLLESLGAKLMKLINFLLDLVPWKAIAKTQKQLMNALEKALGAMSGAKVNEIRAEIEDFFDDLREKGEGALDKLTLQLGGKVEPGGGIKDAAGAASAKTKKLDKSAGKATKKIEKLLSKPLELVNWLINKLLEKLPVLSALTKLLAKVAKTIKGIIADITKCLGKAFKVLPPALGSSLTNLMAIAKNPADAPNYIASAVLQLAKGVMGVSLELVSELIDVVFRGLGTLAQLLLDLGKTDLFPGKKKKGGKVPFITEFYNFVVGGNLSLFKLVTWLLAVPITLLHLAIYGAAPDLSRPAKRASADKIRQTSYVIAGALCSVAELAIHAFLDAIDLSRGIDKYKNIETGAEQSFADKHPKATLGLEIGALACATLDTYFGNPYEFDPAPKKGKDIADHVFYWIGVAQLGADIISLAVDQKRMVRADLEDDVEGREGSWGTLAVEFCILTAKSVIAIVYKRKGPGIASDLLDSAGAVVEAGILSAFPKSNAKAAAACVASDIAFGLSSLGTGLAADLG